MYFNSSSYSIQTNLLPNKLLCLKRKRCAIRADSVYRECIVAQKTRKKKEATWTINPGVSEMHWSRCANLPNHGAKQ